MKLEELVRLWFETWESGEFQNIPVADSFRHTSPFGTTTSKAEYLELVRSNVDQFLGFEFEIHDEIYEAKRACVRYAARKGDFSLEASEWFYENQGQIGEIVSYYHLGDELSYSDAKS